MLCSYFKVIFAVVVNTESTASSTAFINQTQVTGAHIPFLNISKGALLLLCFGRDNKESIGTLMAKKFYMPEVFGGFCLLFMSKKTGGKSYLQGPLANKAFQKHRIMKLERACEAIESSPLLNPSFQGAVGFLCCCFSMYMFASEWLPGLCWSSAALFSKVRYVLLLCS